MYIKAKFPIIFVLIIALFVSCIPRPNCRKAFNLFKRPVVVKGGINVLKTDGIYISETGNAAFFIYKNGKIKGYLGGVESYPQEHMQSSETVLQNMESDRDYSSKEFWGDYEIKNNEIRIQTFTVSNEYFYKRFIYEEIGRIVNESTFEIYACYPVIGKDTVLRGGVCRMKFYPTTVKPDSTKAWFNNRKWYTNNLHKTRRTQ